MMFASLVVEREPLQWSDLPAGLVEWVQTVGGFAAAAVIVWVIYQWFARMKQTPSQSEPAWRRMLFRLAVVGIVVGYGVWGILRAPTMFQPMVGEQAGTTSTKIQAYALLVGGISAIVAVALPMLLDLLLCWRWRRIWALTRLSFKEALRRRVLWGFSAFLLVLLFATWFTPYKYEDQVRNYVRVVYWAMTPLLLLVAGLLAAFSIPADMRNLTIHTIVTKPVERFEIVLGRFLGYTLLMTLVLAVMTGISLIYLQREIDPDAKYESMHARVPVFGKLRYSDGEGTNVGYEWEYRKHIAGGVGSKQRAIWTFTDLPSGLANRKGDWLPCEFTFDVFRTTKGDTTKGEEGKGVFCNFAFMARNWDPKQKPAYDDLRDRTRRSALQLADKPAIIQRLTQEVLERKPTDEEINSFREDKSANASDRLIAKLLAEKFDYFEIPSKEVVDYHTQSIEVPTVLIQHALAAEPRKAGSRGGEDRPPLEVQVRCDSATQYVGMARHDFYLLAADKPFTLNFIKGSIGLWMRLCLVIGLALVFSTYMSGVIAWLATMFFYILGGMQDYIKSVIDNTVVGGGPMEAMIRLLSREGPVNQLDPTPGYHLAVGADQAYRVVLRVVQNLFPDIDRLDWTDYVTEGFNISTSQMVLVNMVALAAYLVPCALVAYYLMKSREIASS